MASPEQPDTVIEVSRDIDTDIQILAAPQPAVSQPAIPLSGFFGTSKPKPPDSLDLRPIQPPTANMPRLPLPTMSEANIDGYFLSLEFWFEASNIRDDMQKYYIVMSQLPPHKMVELKRMIEDVPPAAKYQYIKTNLINQYTDSQQRRLKRVLSEMPLGDQKPGAFYNIMARVAEGALTESALVDLWASRLPESIHAAVAATDGTISTKIRVADAIFDSLDLRSTAATINEIQTQPTISEAPGPSDKTAKDLVPEVIELVQMIAAMMRDSPRHIINQRPRNSYGPRDQSNPTVRRRLQFPRRPISPVQDEQEALRQPRWRPPVRIITDERRDFDQHPKCWYHRTYGQQARTCRPPCTYQQEQTQ